ncbi:MAG TPA: diacylglycerol kinase family protein [Gaiellaceae bacterium]|nr:diacylglycerol kinase family protein [Gaiellaceae bacterium]
MRRAVLIVNPFSTAVTQERVAEVEAVLRTRVELETRHTEAPGHATELAASAAGTADAIVVFSGDGTYNEAINGAAGSIPFAFLPGGGASVLPRALGLPRNPAAAAKRVADALAQDRTRSISLGRVNGRRFCFAAGIGLDAEAVRRVDKRGRSADGRRAPNAAFATAAFGYLSEHRFRLQPELEIAGEGEVAFVLVGVGRPYTYLGPMPVTLGREMRYDGGLDFVGPKVVSPLTVPRVLGRALLNNLHSDTKMVSGQDVDRIEVRCARPFPLEADGEDLGDVTEAIFESERNALDVLV